MTSAMAISPNEPDIMPQYVDGKPPPKAWSRPEPVPEIVPEVIPEVIPESVAPSSTHREGECVPNVPDATPALLSAEEEKALGERGEKSAPQPALDFTPPVSPWWKWHLTATILLAGLFGALIFSQAISAVAFAATLPEWAQYTLLIPFGLCCLAVLGVCVSLFRSWFRLRAMRQIDLGALEQLRLRAQTRQDGVEHFQAARAQVEKYLRAYPLSAESQPRLQAAGLSLAQVDALAAGRSFLAGREVDSRSWLAEFRDQYQSVLDTAAAARVSSWSLKAAGCVIASPLPLLDAVLVLGIALKLIKDLSVIYNVRTGRTGSLLILNKAIAAAFIAGVAEEATETAADLAAEQFGGLFGAKVVGAVAPKLGEGAINALFIRRLGKATIRLLQPAKPIRKGKE